VRYRVEFRYREDTGEVEVLQVDTVETGQRATDHDAQHDRVAAELASVVEQFADIEEVIPGGGPGLHVWDPVASPPQQETTPVTNQELREQ
jgi:FtsH ternary system domain X3